jgi:hypothetical protein
MVDVEVSLTSASGADGSGWASRVARDTLALHSSGLFTLYHAPSVLSFGLIYLKGGGAAQRHGLPCYVHNAP